VAEIMVKNNNKIIINPLEFPPAYNGTIKISHCALDIVQGRAENIKIKFIISLSAPSVKIFYSNIAGAD